MMVDAEHSHFQPVIDALALRLKQRYNRDAPIILNTYQVGTGARLCELVRKASAQQSRQTVAFYLRAASLRHLC